MHSADIENSQRLRLALAFIRSAGSLGVTTIELQGFTGSMAPATDVSEIRKNGYDIRCTYDHKTERGRKVYRYFYKGKEKE